VAVEMVMESHRKVIYTVLRYCRISSARPSWHGLNSVSLLKRTSFPTALLLW